jgi:hypothetical protein
VKEANRLIQHMFVERMQGIDGRVEPSMDAGLDATA